MTKNRAPIAEVPLHEVAKMHAWKASSAGMQSWLLNGGFIEKKRDPTVGVPLHGVAEMHAWEASGAGMRSSLQFHGGQCGYSHTFARNGCWCCTLTLWAQLPAVAKTMHAWEASGAGIQP